MQLVADHANAETPVSFVEVAVVSPHVDDARNTATITGREGPLVQCHLFNGFRLENGEDA